MMDERLTDLERQFCEVNDLRVQHFADLMKAQAENARLRAQLEAVRDIHRPDPSALRWCEACEERIPCPTTAALRNEGGDDG